MASEIKSGDVVNVTDWGEAYSTCPKWFVDRMDKLDPQWVACYAYGDRHNFTDHRTSDDRKYVVLYIEDGNALITNEVQYRINSQVVRNPVYLIDANGLAIHESAKSEEEAVKEDTKELIRALVEFLFS